VIVEPSAGTVYLVSCVGQKRPQACPARDLYVSDWFLKARCYAEVSGAQWFILSAEHGLLAPDRVISPYERTLKRMPVAARRDWAARVADQLASAVPELTHVVVLAGERYREFLACYLVGRGVRVSVPMEGLRIGEQLRWLGKRTLEPATPIFQAAELDGRRRLD
jgi:hypothetical protein